MNTITKTVGLSLLMGLFGTAEAGHGHGKGPGVCSKAFSGPRLTLLAEKVGLSEQQVEKIRKISTTAQRAKIDIKSQLKKTRLELQELMEGSRTPNEAKVSKLIEKMGRIHTALKKNRIMMMLRVGKVLNDEQWKKMQLMFAKHRGKHGKDWKGPGSCGHQGKSCGGEGKCSQCGGGPGW